MAEVDPTASAARPAAGSRTGNGFELRLERGGAHVRLGAPAQIAGLLVEALDLAVPDVALPIDAGAGPVQFRNRLCELQELSVLAEPATVETFLARIDLAELGLESLQLALRQGFAELGGRLIGGPAFALRLGLVPGFDRGITVIPYAPRLFGPSAVPAAALPHLAARALSGLGLPDDPLPLLLRRLLVTRGWKVPRADGVRLSACAVTPAGVLLTWTREPPAPGGPPVDPELLAALEGARAFAPIEALAAGGEWAGARDAWLSDPAASTHPFAADRLLSLLCLDERFHDEALDLAQTWLERQPRFAPALAAEAWIRTLRGEGGRAAEALVALAEEAVTRGEKLAAAAAAEAALATPGAPAAILARAVDAALAVKRDHLPALRALRQLAHESGDTGARLRAARRLLAYAPTDLEKARAHAELGELLLDRDPPAARLHLDRALRLAPGDVESLATLARACSAAGEHLRAIGALDRLRALRLQAGDLAGAARLALEAGAIWEERLAHPENALLRFREAAELGPGAAEAHRRAAACAERLGRWTEAADHHASALAALDRTAPDAGARTAAHHLALADVAELRLDDPTGAATHLEAALASGPADPRLLSRLVALLRQLGRPAELLAALDRLAPLTEPPAARLPIFLETAELALGPLARPDLAASRFAAALALDPDSHQALEGLAALARQRGDASTERDLVQRLLASARNRAEEAAMQDRLAASCERLGDLPGAARAVAAARRAEPSRARLLAAAAIARRSGDQGGLAALLVEVAHAALAEGDLAGAGTAWRERAESLAGTDPALALTALAEARRLTPDDPRLLRLEASLAERAAEPKRALDALVSLLATAPTDAAALEVRAARAALAAGQAPAALAHADRALAGGAAEAGAMLGEVLEQVEDQAGTVPLLRTAGRHLEAAALLERLGDRAGAVEALERARRVPDQAGAALRQLVRLHAESGDAAAAADALLGAALHVGGREGAELAWRAFQLTSGEEALDVAARSDPGFAPARAERAARRAGQDAAGALADAEAALAGEALDPARRPPLLRLSAQLAERTGDRELARRRLASWCQSGVPDDGELARLAALHRDAGDEDRLAATLQRRLATAPAADHLGLRLELAALLAKLGREAEAVACWRHALELDPKSTAALDALLEPARAALLPEVERENLQRRRDDDEGLELQAHAAAQAGDLKEAARLFLERARRAVRRGEPGSADRLAEAGLSALDAGLEQLGAEALGEALVLEPDPERARAALVALTGLAAAASDVHRELELLPALIARSPTGERPAQLLRLAQLRSGLGDTAGALEAAEQARTLAPRHLETVRASRLAAAAAGDLATQVARLGEEAALDVAGAGPLLLERARLLQAAGEHEAADDTLTEALAKLPPDQATALEQVRLRRAWLPKRPAAEPMERFAERLEDAAASARAYAAAAALAYEATDTGAALRCARRAFARSRQQPALAGPLLARLLYGQGAFAEALVVHRTLFELGFPGFDDGEVVTLCGQLAELASDDGDQALALAALDRLLALRPQEADAAEQRFRLDPDRRRAVAGIEAVAPQIRSVARRIELLALAGEAALAWLHDRRAGERIFRQARADGSHDPALLARLEHRRADATRAGDLGPEALLSSLRDAADAHFAAGELEAAVALLAEAVAEARARGMKPAAAHDLGRLEVWLSGAGDPRGAAAWARELAAILTETGDREGAIGALRRVLAVWPGDAAAEAAMTALLGGARRGGEQALELLEQARRLDDPAARAGLRREAARLLSSSDAASDRSLAADVLVAVTSDLPGDVVAGRAAAEALVACGRAEEALPLLAALVRASPGNEPLLAVLERLTTPPASSLGPAPTLPAEETIEAAIESAAAGEDAGGSGVERDSDLEREAVPEPSFTTEPTIEFGELTEAERSLRTTLEFSPPKPEATRVVTSPGFPKPELEEPAAAPLPELPVVDLDDRELRTTLEFSPPKPEATRVITSPGFPRPDLEAPAPRSTNKYPPPPVVPPVEPPAEPAFAEPEHEAAAQAALAEATADPVERSAAWLASARALERASAAPERIRLALELACESDPDAAAPWQALAVLERNEGQLLAAARALLAVSIRTEGTAAGQAALAAAAIFVEAELPQEARRALRAASLVDPGCVTDDLKAAVDAMDAPAEIPLAGVVEPLPSEPIDDFGDLSIELTGEPETAPTLAPPAEPSVELAFEIDAVAPTDPSMDPVAAMIRAEAEAAYGSDRAALLERLAGLLERRGDGGGAADALMEALSSDPQRDLTWAWLDSLVEQDPERKAMAGGLRELLLETAPALTPAPLPPEPPTAPAEGPAERNPEAALEAALSAARTDPTDVAALLEIVDRSEELAVGAAHSDAERHSERARLARSLAVFLAPDRLAAGDAPRLSAALSESARDRVAVVGAVGPLARLLALLAPHLEPLFPADLARRGVTAGSRLVAPDAPEILGPLELAAQALSPRPYAAFRIERADALIELENTRPPSLIVPSGFEALPPQARHFLAARALDLLSRGWTLTGKFAPRDVGILLELACRFAGGEPPSLGLPAARAGAFLSALAKSVPPAITARAQTLGPAAAEELGRTELSALAEAIRLTSGRVALLATGDPGAALTGLLATEAVEMTDRAAALARGERRELALLALSEPFLDLRVAVVG